jgi:hypothetical protein
VDFSFGTRTRCALASAGLLTGLAGVVVPASSASSPAASPAIQAIDQALANVHLGAPNRLVHGNTLRIPGLNHLSSENWAGYEDDNSKGNSYTTVSGHWAEPAVKCIRNTDQEMVVFFAGIDGLTDSTVEQDGTGALCNAGAITYFDWWEMYPANAIQAVSVINVGDSITSSVKYAAGAYTLKVTDATHASDSFTSTQTCASTCSNASADFNAERPSNGSTFLVLPNFGTWTLSKASVKSGATTSVISHFPDDAVTMANSSNQVMTSVTALNLAGNSFKAVWHRSA